MIVTAFFTENTIPKTGLSPTILIWKTSDNSVVVNSASMTEVAGGFYKYDFTTYVDLETYAIRCDGGAGLSAEERYTIGTFEPDVYKDTGKIS